MSAEITRMSAHIKRRDRKAGRVETTRGGVVASLPEPIPGCGFRRRQSVLIDGAIEALVLDLVRPAEGEGIVKLWPVEGGGCAFVRLGRIEAVR